MKLELDTKLGTVLHSEDCTNITTIQKQAIGLLYELSEINKLHVDDFIDMCTDYYQADDDKKEYSEDFKNCCRAFSLPLIHTSADGIHSYTLTNPEQITNIPKDLHVDFIDGQETEEFKDPINPDYYKQGTVECIDIIEQWPLCIGTAIKYLWRYKDKENPIQDLNKAIWYLERQIALMKKLEKSFIFYNRYTYTRIKINAILKHIKEPEILEAMYVIWGNDMHGVSIEMITRSIHHITCAIGDIENA